MSKGVRGRDREGWGRARRTQRQTDRDWERGGRNRNLEEEGETETETDRQTDTHTHTHAHWYPLISQVISFPGATLPWASAFPTLGQNPQLLTFCVGWLVAHNFFYPPPGMAGSDPRSRGSCQGPG